MVNTPGALSQASFRARILPAPKLEKLSQTRSIDCSRGCRSGTKGISSEPSIPAAIACCFTMVAMARVRERRSWTFPDFVTGRNTYASPMPDASSQASRAWIGPRSLRRADQSWSGDKDLDALPDPGDVLVFDVCLVPDC